MRIGPVAFLFVVAATWSVVRAILLWPETNAPATPRRVAWQPALDPPASAVEQQAAELPSVPFDPAPGAPASPGPSKAPSFLPRLVASAAADAMRTPEPPPRTTAAPILPPQPAPPSDLERSRLSLSAWAIIRGDAGPSLASAGQLGGSQAGVRARYDLGSGFAAALRVSGPLRSHHGKEAAVALDWRPMRHAPVTVTIERRAGLDRGGRDAFAVGVSGGGEVSLPFGARGDGYGQAGLVGLKRRDVYIDGAVRIERTLVRSRRFRIAAGAGAWGGAQPGVSRIDVGPQLVAHVPVGKGGLRIGAEWRARVAGDAQPDSGPALSIGADF
jgi:hypothetical protein